MENLIRIPKPVYILSSATVVGQHEKNGPLGEYFDIVGDKDDTFGCDTWEKSESEMQRLALSRALNYACMKDTDLETILAGDLLNQCAGSSYGLVSFETPFLGLFGACSTAAEALLLSALLCSSHMTRCAAVSSSHNASAERQFRYPLEYGGQRAPTAQWTVTGSAAFISTSCKDDFSKTEHKGKPIPVITEVVIGKSIDAGITDANNMGAAMAPSAADTLLRYFRESDKQPSDFDIIMTGDLGYEGSNILCDLTAAESLDISAVHCDSGLIIYDRETQDKHAGGSGCGCSAVVLAAQALRGIHTGQISNILFIGTGALMNPTAIQQGASIPGIAHLIRITADII